MSILNSREFLPASSYNALPLVEQTTNVEEKHAAELEVLRAILNTHGNPTGVSVRLLHRHFNLHDNEVMLFEKLVVQGRTSFMMAPKKISATDLHGTHYLVNPNGSFSPYEYIASASELPDMSEHTELLAEFSQFILQNNLQNVFGLKLRMPSSGEEAFVEHEIPEYRGHLLLPADLSLTPENSYSITTEWLGTGGPADGCTHSCSHSMSCRHEATHGRISRLEEENTNFLTRLIIESAKKAWCPVQRPFAL